MLNTAKLTNIKSCIKSSRFCTVSIEEFAKLWSFHFIGSLLKVTFVWGLLQILEKEIKLREFIRNEKCFWYWRQ